MRTVLDLSTPQEGRIGHVVENANVVVIPPLHDLLVAVLEGVTAIGQPAVTCNGTSEAGQAVAQLFRGPSRTEGGSAFEDNVQVDARGPSVKVPISEQVIHRSAGTNTGAFAVGLTTAFAGASQGGLDACLASGLSVVDLLAAVKAVQASVEVIVETR